MSFIESSNSNSNDSKIIPFTLTHASGWLQRSETSEYTFADNIMNEVEVLESTSIIKFTPGKLLNILTEKDKQFVSQIRLC
jgi:hypothetical protein